MSEESQSPARKKFTTKCKEILIDIENEQGELRTFTLREMIGTSRDKFMNDMSVRMKTGPDGKPTGMLKDVTRLHSVLLNLCLFDDANKAIPVEDLQKWPTTVLSDLYDMATDLNNLKDRKAEEELAKND